MLSAKAMDPNSRAAIRLRVSPGCTTYIRNDSEAEVEAGRGRLPAPLPGRGCAGDRSGRKTGAAGEPGPAAGRSGEDAVSGKTTDPEATGGGLDAPGAEKGSPPSGDEVGAPADVIAPLPPGGGGNVKPKPPD